MSPTRPSTRNASPMLQAIATISSASGNASQIKHLLRYLTMQEIASADGTERDHRPGALVMTVVKAGGEREYVCRGSLTARAMHGVRARRRLASGEVREIEVTKSQIDF